MCQNDNPDSNCVTKLFVLRFKILKTQKFLNQNQTNCRQPKEKQMKRMAKPCSLHLPVGRL